MKKIIAITTLSLSITVQADPSLLVGMDLPTQFQSVIFGIPSESIKGISKDTVIASNYSLISFDGQPGKNYKSGFQVVLKPNGECYSKRLSISSLEGTPVQVSELSKSDCKVFKLGDVLRIKTAIL